jgi:hypothetical protein
MVRPGLLLLPGFLVAVSAFGQIILPGQQVPGQYPGQYPGQSRYPGGASGPFPGSRGSTTTTRQDNQAPVTTLNGLLRQVQDTNLVLESDDKRIVTISLANGTRYFKASGGNGRLRDLEPGDHLSIDTTQDDNGFYHAVRVTQIQQGTPQERAAASRPVDTSPIGPDADSGNKGNSNGDDDRPRLQRASNADSTKTSQPAAPDPDDPGPPVLRRGPPREVAENRAPDSDSPISPRPSIHAEDVNGVTRPPEAPKVDNSTPHSAPDSAPGGRPSFRPTGDPVIDMAREQAFSFTETLPNYVVKQFTTRYETEAARGGQTSWRALDTVSADVVSENGKESYKNILIDGKAPKEAIEKTGSWSTGEYSSVLLDILEPDTDADFHNKRPTTIVSRPAFRYDFSVEQPNSHWHIYAGPESYKPEYTGSIWIDKENYRVLRIELSARNVPKTFPLDTVESAIDYDYVMIGGTRFLLPVHSEALSCERGTSDCNRNVIEFRNYKKFGADTSITFDSPQ